MLGQEDSPLGMNGEYVPTAELVALLIGLVDKKTASKVLIIEFGNHIASAAEVLEYDSVHIQSTVPLNKQVDEIIAKGPYDGAIVLPTFSALGADVDIPQGWGELKRPFREDLLVAHAVESLKPDGNLVALVPNGLLANHGRKTLRCDLVDRGVALVALIPQDILFRTPKTTPTGLLYLRRNKTAPDRQILFADLIYYSFGGLPPILFWREELEEEASDDAIFVRVPVSELNGDCRLDPQYYDPAYLQINPPPGYIEFALGEIAKIRGGIAVDKASRSETPVTSGSIPYLQVRHILGDGTIARNPFWVEASEVPDCAARVARAGDILVTISGTVGKVALVPASFHEGVLYDTSLRRIIVDSGYAQANVVAQFLQSEIGQLQFRRLTGGTVIPQVTTPLLETMRIFLPERVTEPTKLIDSAAEVPEITGNLAQARLIADSLETGVVRYLQELKADDTTWPATIDKALRGLIKDLVPKPLDKAVLEDFPAPIAIPYRRFQMARYNNYERLDRMVALVESCIYFAYNVLLADYGSHRWYDQHISLTKDAHQAVKGKQSIDYRLKFVDEICEAARHGTVALFMPELTDSKVAIVGDLVRDQVRNPISHSAPGSEPYVRSLIEKYLSSVDDLLESLRFLTTYSLCRIRSHNYGEGKWHYQAEYYRGAEYDVNIQETSMAETSEGQPLIAAERDHLVLLNGDNETLDLHPLYQLYFGDETCRESHLCFVKYLRDNELISESIRSSVELQLSGVEAFRFLTNTGSDGNSKKV